MRWSFNLDHIRLRNKFLILYILCVLIPIVITNLSFYQATSDNVREQKMRDISRALEQVKNEFKMKTEDAVSISTVILPDYTLNHYLEREYSHPTEYVAEYDSYARKMLNSYMPVYTIVQNIRIYVDNPTLMHSGAIGYLSDEVRQTSWYQAIADTSGSTPVLVRTRRENQLTTSGISDARDAFSIVRRMNYFLEDNKWEKILKIEMRMPPIHQVFNNLNLSGYIYLLNPQGIIEYTTDPRIAWDKRRVDFSDVELPSDHVLFETVYEDVQYMRGWKLVGAISEEEVFRDVRESREYVVWMALFNLLFSTIIIIWITRSMNVRLVRILRHMKKVKNQKFETIKEADSRDEIGQLTGEFNRMTLQIKSLIDDVYIADIQKKTLEIERRQAQLNALQSQINPHFLFNSLETIRMRSLMKQEHETAKIIQNMAVIMRNSLTWTKDFITVQEELLLIERFLEIQKYRFGDKLQYTIEADEEALPYKIPKLSILPFVENASIHGIEPLKAGGEITIRVELQQGMVVCSVVDNGIGMSEEKLQKLRSFVDQEVEMGERIGVQNVIYRLRLYFEDQFTCEFDSKPWQGTRIVMSVPANQE